MERNPYHEDDWRAYATCIESDPNLFFPVGTTGLAEEQIAAAKAICAECVVKEDCLEYALSTRQESGIWGGTTEEERRKLHRQWLRNGRKLA